MSRRIRWWSIALFCSLLIAIAWLRSSRADSGRIAAAPELPTPVSIGTVQRRGTIDAALERLVDRPLRQIDPPVLAGLRLGIYELLFADGTPDQWLDGPDGTLGPGYGDRANVMAVRLFVLVRSNEPSVGEPVGAKTFNLAHAG